MLVVCPNCKMEFDDNEYWECIGCYTSMLTKHKIEYLEAFIEKYFDGSLVEMIQ